MKHTNINMLDYSTFWRSVNW